MTTFTENWDLPYEARPAVSDLLKDTLQPTLVGLKKNTRERMVVEHAWGQTDGSDGIHKFRRGTTADRDALNPKATGMLFFNTTRNVLEMWSGSGWNSPLMTAGIKITMFHATVPSGWVLVTDHNDRVVRLVSNPATAGAESGQWAITGLTTASDGGETLEGTFNTGTVVNLGGSVTPSLSDGSGPDRKSVV